MSPVPGTGIKATFSGPVTRVDSADLEGLGALRIEQGKIYKYVKLANASATVALAAGDPVAYLAVTGYSTNTVVSDLTDADTAPLGGGVATGVVAGVAGTSYYIWVQIKGPATALTTVPGADGGALTMSTTDKTFLVPTAHGHTRCASAIDASAKTIYCDFPW